MRLALNANPARQIICSHIFKGSKMNHRSMYGMLHCKSFSRRRRFETLIKKLLLFPSSFRHFEHWISAWRLRMLAFFAAERVASSRFWTLTMVTSMFEFSTIPAPWLIRVLVKACFSITVSNNVFALLRAADGVCKDTITISNYESVLQMDSLSSSAVWLRQSSSSSGMTRSGMCSSM